MNIKIPNETIVAIASPPGRGGVGVVRVSGPLSKSIAEKITCKTLCPRYAVFCKFYSDENEVLDQGLALFFNAPHSFTGEDILELHGHGGMLVLDRIVQQVLKLGARLARPGEFSERAFLNGKIDLAQAESIADLIDASTEQAAKLAIRSLQGEFSSKINDLVESLIQLRTYIEASIDFSEEEIDYIPIEHIEQQLNQLIERVNTIHSAAQKGAILREGKKVVIAGKPNAGKSSLLNQLSGRETAIVTEVAGTTRDVLREYIQVDGVPLHIIDTAGLQQTKDIVEQEGIKRAWQEIDNADAILLVVDAKESSQNDIKVLWPEFYKKYGNKRSVAVIQNKIDLIDHPDEVKMQDNQATLYLSAKTGKGIELLRRYLKDTLTIQDNSEGLILARRRHIVSIERAADSLQAARTQLTEFRAYELCAEELLQTQKALSEITGAFTTDDLLGKIFSTFCVGK